MKYPEQNIKVPRFNEDNGFYTTKARSRIMSRIKGKDTKPEIRFRRALWHAGVHYHTDVKTLPGKPDIANKRLKLAIFIDGEFWHGHNWEVRKENIKSNRSFWIPKIERNRQRDQQVNRQLEAMGYKVFRFWSHEVNKNLGACLSQVLHYLGYH